MTQSQIVQLRNGLRKMGGRVLNPNNLIDRIAKKTGMRKADIVLALDELRQLGEVSSQVWDNQGVPATKIYLNLPPEPLKDYEVRWIEVLNAQADKLSNSDKLALEGCSSAVKQMSIGDMKSLLGGLLQLRDDIEKNQSWFNGARAFDVSAQYLIGSSKLLPSLPKKNMATFGIDVDIFNGPPQYVIIAGSKKSKATILVENPHSFEAAVRADKSASFCWIATYGYGLSKSGENYGEQLVDLVDRKTSIISLSRRDPYVELGEVLHQAKDNLYFWGDLDLAGLDIYRRLKTKLERLKLSPLYAPMIEKLNNGGGHDYLSAQKDGQSLKKHSFEELNKLSDLCQARGIDQESVSLNEEILFKLHR